MTDDFEEVSGAVEVCFLLGEDDAVLWSDASASPVALPDSRGRWEVIWAARERIVEIAHTHPLGGAFFSEVDETTMRAIDSGLGREMRYAVETPDAMMRREPGVGDVLVPEGEQPWWVELIRVASGVRR